MNPTEVASLGSGVPYDVAVQDSLAYTAAGGGLLVWDVSNATDPELVGGCDTPEWAVSVAVSGDYAYVGTSTPTGPAEVLVVNVADPSKPAIVGSCATSESVLRLAAAGSLVYAVDQDHGLRIIDASTPTAPTEVGLYANPSGASFDVAVSGNYAYLGTVGAVRILDISNPAAPVQVGAYAAAGLSAESLALTGHYVCFSDTNASTAGLYVLDVTDPAHPTLVGSLSTVGAGALQALAASGDTVLATQPEGGSSALRVFSIADAAKPALLGSLDGVSASHLAISGTYAYLASPEAGALIIVDISTPSAPAEVGSTPSLGAISSLAVGSDRVYVAGGDQISTARYMKPLGIDLLSVYDSPVSADRVTVSGNDVYDLSASGRVTILEDKGSGMGMSMGKHGDLSEVGSYTFTGVGADLAVQGDDGYVADPESKLLRIFVAQGHDAGQELATVPLDATALALQGGYLYAAGNGKLTVLSLSNPLTPTTVGECDLDTGDQSPRTIAVSDGRLCIAALKAGLIFVDVASPTNPAQEAVVPTEGETYDVAVQGAYAYVADGLAGLRLLDITGPTAPAEVASYQTWGEAKAVAVQGDRVYLGDSGRGLSVLRCAPGFTDVDGTNWAYAAIQACYREDIANGYPDGSYLPGEVVTRDQMAVYISRGAAGGDDKIQKGNPHQSFADVPASSWAHDYIEYAADHGIVQGYPDGYHPDEPVSRAQMAAFVARAVAGGDANVPAASATSFTDVPPGYWALKYIAYVQSKGIVQGYSDGTYQPEAPVTRDQMAVFVARAFHLPM